MAINQLALPTLLAPKKGFFDKYMGIGLQGMYEIMSKSWEEFRMEKDMWLPADLEHRRVESDTLPVYAYRDDALLLHNAIHKYVGEIVSIAYDSQEKLDNDYEVQNWVKCLSDKDQGDIKGVFCSGAGEKFVIEDLMKTCTAIIFNASVGHAAANFGQYDDYGFPPNYPTQLNGKMIENKQDISEQEIMEKHILDRAATQQVISVTHVLSQKDTNSLGNFEVQYMHDPKAVAAVTRFREDLTGISVTIQERIKERGTEYTYLDPKNVPNAISI